MRSGRALHPGAGMPLSARVPGHKTRLQQRLGAGGSVAVGSSKFRSALSGLEAEAAHAAERKSRGLARFGANLLKSGGTGSRRGLDVYDPTKHAVTSQVVDEQKWMA